jgi:hypothetical protein
MAAIYGSSIPILKQLEDVSSDVNPRQENRLVLLTRSVAECGTFWRFCTTTFISDCLDY